MNLCPKCRFPITSSLKAHVDLCFPLMRVRERFAQCMKGLAHVDPEVSAKSSTALRSRRICLLHFLLLHTYPNPNPFASSSVLLESYIHTRELLFLNWRDARLQVDRHANDPSDDITRLRMLGACLLLRLDMDQECYHYLKWFTCGGGGTDDGFDDEDSTVAFRGSDSSRLTTESLKQEFLASFRTADSCEEIWPCLMQQRSFIRGSGRRFVVTPLSQHTLWLLAALALLKYRALVRLKNRAGFEAFLGGIVKIPKVPVVVGEVEGEVEGEGEREEGIQSITSPVFKLYGCRPAISLIHQYIFGSTRRGTKPGLTWSGSGSGSERERERETKPCKMLTTTTDSTSAARAARLKTRYMKLLPSDEEIFEAGGSEKLANKVQDQFEFLVLACSQACDNGFFWLVMNSYHEEFTDVACATGVAVGVSSAASVISTGTSTVSTDGSVSDADISPLPLPLQLPLHEGASRQSNTNHAFSGRDIKNRLLAWDVAMIESDEEFNLAWAAALERGPLDEIYSVSGITQGTTESIAKAVVQQMGPAWLATSGALTAALSVEDSVTESTTKCFKSKKK
jgi:hypothetical protein